MRTSRSGKLYIYKNKLGAMVGRGLEGVLGRERVVYIFGGFFEVLYCISGITSQRVQLNQAGMGSSPSRSHPPLSYRKAGRWPDRHGSFTHP